MKPFLLASLIVLSVPAAVSAQSLMEASAAALKAKAESSQVWIAPRTIAAAEPVTPEASTAAGTESGALSTDVTKEPYWRERRRAFDTKLRADMAADKAATDLFLLMDKTGIMRSDPAAYVKAMNDMKQASAVVSDDVSRGMPELQADAKRAGVPAAWVKPTDR